jgi:hypothetical protein
MPHFSISPPAKTKAGMASNTQLCEPDTMLDDRTCKS